MDFRHRRNSSTEPLSLYASLAMSATVRSRLHPKTKKKAIEKHEGQKGKRHEGKKVYAPRVAGYSRPASNSCAAAASAGWAPG